MLGFQHNRPAALSGGRTIDDEALQSHARTDAWNHVQTHVQTGAKGEGDGYERLR